MDKKIKNAGDIIKMPEDMKERIIKNCESAEKTKFTCTDSDDGYIELASGTDRVDTQNRIVRLICAIAACAVLVAGIGTTGVLIHRQNTKLIGSDVNDEAYRIMSPFGDFSTLPFRLFTDDGKNGNYSAETYEKLAAFLNGFDWGEELEEDETRTYEQDAKGPIYSINWFEGNRTNHIYIANDGFVSYIEYQPSDNIYKDSLDVVEQKYFKIDLDSFGTSIEEILAQDTEKISPFGDFREFEFIFKADMRTYRMHSKGTINDRLCDLLNNFDWGEGVDEPAPENEVLHYSLFDYAVQWQKDQSISTWKDDFIYYGIYIESSGRTIYEIIKDDYDHMDSEVIERKVYQIDFNDFANKYHEIISNGEYINENEINALTIGEFQKVAFYNYMDKEYGNYLDKDHGPFSNDEDKRTKLEEFLKNDFFRMLKIYVPIEPDDSVDELEYDSDSEPVGSGPDFEIEFEYKMEDEKTIRKMDFSIYDGDVKMHEWIEDVDGLGNGSYTLDVKEFENRLAELGIDLSIRTTEDDIEESEHLSYDSIYDILKSVEVKRRAYLKGYSDVEIVVELRDAEDNEIMLSDENMEKLKTFVENEFQFDLMLKSDPINGEYSYEYQPQTYGIDIKYMSGGKVVLGRYYNISGNGIANLSDCEYDSNGGSTWSGPFIYYLDINEFYAKLEECGAR